MDGEENNQLADAGETLMRTYNVSNEGTTTLSELCITDEKFGVDCLACAVLDDGQLPPGTYFECTVSSAVSRSRNYPRYGSLDAFK